jgi:hypothetical protein
MPDLASALSFHLSSNPQEKWLEKAYIFQSAGATGELLYVLYDEKMWRSFADGYEKALLSLCPKYKDLKKAFVGSKDKRHTLPRVAQALGFAEAIIGLQDDTPIVLEQLRFLEPELIICYGGFLEMLVEFSKKGSLNFIPRSILVTTEGASEEIIQEIKNTFGCDVVTLLSSTEVGVIGHTCKNGNYHLNAGISVQIDTEGQAFFTNNVNELHLFKNCYLPLQFLEVPTCSCGVPSSAFKILGGRITRLFRFSKADGTETFMHPISLRSVLDLIDGFPGARVRQDGNTIIVELLAPWDKIAELEIIVKAHFQKMGLSPMVKIVEKE